METPNAGGAYIRNRDGTLERVEHPAAELGPGSAAAPGEAGETERQTPEIAQADPGARVPRFDEEGSH